MTKDDPKLTFSQAVDGYRIHAMASRLSHHTLFDYNNTYNRFLQFMENDPIFEEITPTDIRQFLASFVNERGEYTRSKKTLLNYYIGLSSLWTWAINDGIVDRHVVKEVNAPEPEKRAIVPYTEKDIKLMLASLRKSAGYKRGKGLAIINHTLLNQKRNRVIILLLLDTGIRVSELCNMKIKHVDLNNLSITVFGKGSKERTLPISSKTAKAIWRYLATRPDAFDHYPLIASTDEQHFKRQSLTRLLKRIGERAGVKNVNAHRFRHTFAINFLRFGGNVYVLQQMLGHSTLDMCKNYLALASNDAAETHRRASPVANWNL